MGRKNFIRCAKDALKNKENFKILKKVKSGLSIVPSNKKKSKQFSYN